MLKVGPCTVVRSYIQIHDEKMRWIITKTTINVLFTEKNSQLLTLSSSTEEIFHVQCQNRPVATLPTWLQQSTFVLRHEKCHYQSHWMRNFRFFFSYFGFLPILEKFERQCLQTIRIFQFFNSHNPRKFRQTTLDWEWLRLYCAFINPTEWRERRLIGDIKHTWKNIVSFHVCCYGFSQGWKS